MHLINPISMEKMVLAKRIGRFLAVDHDAKERAAVEDVIRKLLDDKNTKVRYVASQSVVQVADLAFDILRKIICDIAEVAVPFILVSPALTDQRASDLVKYMADDSRKALLERDDIGPLSLMKLAQHGDHGLLSLMVRNDRLTLVETVIEAIIDRFNSDQTIMDQLSGREDLPGDCTDALLPYLSRHFKEALEMRQKSALQKLGGDASVTDNLLRHVGSISRAQMHAHVMDMRKSGKLTMPLMLSMAEKGSMAFLESGLALEAGMAISEVREIFSRGDRKAFVELMKSAKVPPSYGPRLMELSGLSRSGLSGQAAGGSLARALA